MSEPVPVGYRAFLSYSHRDTAWGKWLHAALEGYRIDKDLVGRRTAAGPVPKTLRPVFRDREDFAAGHSLTEQTAAALEASQFLVVICSPNAARSKYVNEEIRRFKALGRGGRVIPIIVDGEPGDAERECFPPALRFKLGPDGELSDEHEEPIAADARPQGDGKEIAKLKLIAGLLAVGFDEIVRRAERARRRRNQFWAGLAVVFLMLAIAATASAIYAWQQLKTNEALLDRALQRATALVNKSAAMSERFGVPRSISHGILEEADVLFRDMRELGRETEQQRYRKAWMLIELARSYETLGDTARQLAGATEARSLLAALVAAKPNDTTYRSDLSTADNEIGIVSQAQGNLPQALQSFRDGFVIREQLARTDPDNAARQRDLSVSFEKIGDVLFDQGKLQDALQSFRDSLAIRQRLATTDPDNRVRQRDLSVSNDKVGSVLARLGDLPGALKAYRESFATRERLATIDPNHTEAQRDLSVSYDHVGRTTGALGKPDEALQLFRDGLAIRDRLARADPSNRILQRDLSASYERVGEALAEQGKLDDALKSFHDSFAIREQLAKADPNNLGWSRDLLVSYNKIGSVLEEQGRLPEALQSFRDGLAIAERLTRAEPNNPAWQRDRQACIGNIGTLAYRFVQAGDFATALLVADQATALAPDQLWLRVNRAHALMFLGRTDEARMLYLRHRGEKVADDKSWEQAVREDFAELRKDGRAHPLMDEIEKQLAP